MCVICEQQLYQEHREAEARPFDPCPDCKRFPGQQCYHCFSVGNTIDECPECQGKTWSDEFLTMKEEMEVDQPPGTIH